MVKIKKFIDALVARTLIFLMGFMLITVIWQVASRYIMADPSIFTDELAGFLLIWVGLLGAGYATGQGLHLAIDLLPRKLEGQGKIRLNLLINFMVFLFALLVMVIGGSRLVYITLKLNQLSASLNLPLGYVYMVLPISGLLIIFYCIWNAWEALQSGSSNAY